MKQKNPSSQIVTDLFLMFLPVAMALGAIVYWRAQDIKEQSSEPSDSKSVPFGESTNSSFAHIDYNENTAITFDLQKTEVSGRHLQGSSYKENLAAPSIRDIKVDQYLTAEMSKYNQGVSTENPFKDMLSDTQAAPATTMDSPAAIIERRVAKRQWLDDLEKTELQVLAKKVQAEALEKGFKVEINKNYEIVSVRPLPRAN